MNARSRVAAIVAFAALTAACDIAVVSEPPSVAEVAVARAPAATPTPDEPSVEVPPEEIEEIAAVLERAAAAFLAADPEPLADVLDEPEGPFGSRWRARAENLAGVPLGTYDLEVDPTARDLATEAVRSRYEAPVRVLPIAERHAIEGFDAEGPAVEPLYLTFVERDDGWRIASDRDGDALGLSGATHLWDLGPVVATEDGPFLALHHPQTADRIPPLLREARAALEDLRPRWSLAWSERVPVIVPRDEQELGRFLNVSFDLSNFIAFATATVDAEMGRYELAGSRIVVNPDRFFARAPETRQRILAHELLHIASRPYAGPHTPSWVEEGVAQRLGEDASTTGLALLQREIARGNAGELPLDAEFLAGGRDRIWLSYQSSFSFAAYLADEHGEEALARFYAALGRGSVGEPGRRSYHLDRAAREVYGQSFADLHDAWTRSLRGP